MLSALIGRWQYTVRMEQAFKTIERGYQSSQSEMAPHQLSGNIDSVLSACAGGLIGFVLGLAILIISIILFVRAGRVASTLHSTSNASGNA